MMDITVVVIGLLLTSALCTSALIGACIVSSRSKAAKICVVRIGQLLAIQ
jgi:hypothetical protein